MIYLFTIVNQQSILQGDYYHHHNYIVCVDGDGWYKVVIKKGVDNFIPIIKFCSLPNPDRNNITLRLNSFVSSNDKEMEMLSTLIETSIEKLIFNNI